MALELDNEYLDVIAGDANYPQGSFKNETTPGALDGTPFEKAWANDIQGILQKILDVSGITPSGNPDTVPVSQYFEGLQEIFNLVVGYDDNTLIGAPNDILLSSKGADPEAYLDGLPVLFKANYSNTGATTVKIGILGTISLTDKNGNSLNADDIEQDSYSLLSYNASNLRFELILSFKDIVPVQRGYIDGLITSNDAVDLQHDIEILPGECRDALNAKNIFLISPITKQIDALWAQGDDQGGFPSTLGTVAADTWYDVFIIANSSTGVVDAGFDTSISAVNLLADASPSGFDIYRRVASVLTDSSSNIIRYVQYGDFFFWYDNTIGLDFSGTTSTSQRTLVTSTPPGINVLAIINILCGNGLVYINNNDLANIAPTTVGWPLGMILGGSGDADAVQAIGMTNKSSQITHRQSLNAQNLQMALIGWYEFRGKE